MINAIIQKKGRIPLVVELPCDEGELRSRLQATGINKSLSQIKLSDDENADIQVSLYSDGDVGKHLSVLFSENDSVLKVIEVTSAIAKANDMIKDELEQAIIYDQYSSVNELYDDIHQMTCDLGQISETFYFPLVGSIYDNEYDEIFTVDNYQIVQYQSEIQQALDAYVDHDDMSEYYNGSGKEKLLLANWGLEEIEGKLYGKVDISFTNPMTEVETESLRKWIIGQNSDGLGEGFEQQDIQIDEGNLNVSFWHSGKDYFLYNLEEMDSYLQQKNDVILGGI